MQDIHKRMLCCCMLQRILTRDYQLPASLSEDGKDFLSSMLTIGALGASLLKLFTSAAMAACKLRHQYTWASSLLCDEAVVLQQPC